MRDDENKVRQIELTEVTKLIKEMCIEANHFLSKDVEDSICEAKEKEESILGKQILSQICENMQIAGKK